jgi:hypothetical protein
MRRAGSRDRLPSKPIAISLKSKVDVRDTHIHFCILKQTLFHQVFQLFHKPFRLIEEIRHMDLARTDQ